MIGIDTEDLEVREAVRDCRACQEECLRAELGFLQQGGTEHEFILLLQAAAGACGMTADSLDRGSELSDRTAAVSAEVCENCLRHCERRGDDPAMKSCVKHFRRCIQICRRICASSMAAGFIVGVAQPVCDSVVRLAAG